MKNKIIFIFYTLFWTYFIDISINSDIVENDLQIIKIDKTHASLEKKISNWYILKYFNEKLNRYVCYMYSNPVNKIGNHKSSRDSYMMIYYITKDKQMIQFSPGYKLKISSESYLEVGNNKHTMINKERIIQSKDIAQDYDIIMDIINSKKYLQIKSDSAYSTYSVDTYDIEYFYMAYISMYDICNSKNIENNSIVNKN